MSELAVKSFPDKDQLDMALADTVAASLAEAIRQRGEASLVVSGGSTPINFFRKLSKKDIDWQHVSVLLADERWVDIQDEDSNEKLLRDNLLINEAGSAQLVSLKSSHHSPVEAEQSLNGLLSRMGTFDLVILGMGGDGHTASLFPQAVNLKQGLDLDSTSQCIAIDPVTAPHQRMSMTLGRLLDSRQVFIHITGEGKKSVLERARIDNNPLQLPIAAVINQEKTPVVLYYAP